MATRLSIWLDGADATNEVLLTRDKDVESNPEAHVTLTVNPECSPTTIVLSVESARELRDFLSTFVRDVDSVPREAQER